MPSSQHELEPTVTASNRHSKVNTSAIFEREYFDPEVVGNVTWWIDPVAEASENVPRTYRLGVMGKA
jgi:hypothetical protein